MATPKKLPVDPLIEELPPEADPPPKSPRDVEFHVLISPYVINGVIHWRWEIVEHTHASHIGSYLTQAGSGYMTETEAEYAAKNWVSRIRETLSVKLNMPASKRIIL